MQREERISRQWPPSEIAMENGNTMIPPVARSALVRGPWGVNNAISIIQTTTSLSGIQNYHPSHFGPVAIWSLSARRENYY